MDNNIIEHCAFNNLFLINNDIFIKYFGKNRSGLDLKKFGTLISRINSVSENVIRDYWDIYPDDIKNGVPIVGTGLNRLKGDVFEIFIEGLLKVLGAHPAIGVYNYKPERRENDWGVDGFGLGADSKSLTVQIKYRADPKMELNKDVIGQFPYQSIIAYGVDLHSNTNLLLITSCNGLHPITRSQVFLSKIREINIEQIKNLVDDNDAFWKPFNYLIDNTIKVTYKGAKLKSVKKMESDVDDFGDEPVIRIPIG